MRGRRRWGVVVLVAAFLATSVATDRGEAGALTGRGRTVHVSAQADGSVGPGYAQWADVSDDGRFVVFQSIDNDMPGSPDDGIFVRDLKLGTTTWAGIGVRPQISGDGRTIVFATVSYPARAVVRDLATASEEVVSVLPDGTTTSVLIDASDVWQTFVIDRTGRFVVVNTPQGVIRRDVELDTTLPVSVDTAGNLRALAPPDHPVSMSDDGNIVTFWTDLNVFVAGDTNGAPDPFVRNMAAGTIVRANDDASGTEPLGAGPATVSGDGRTVVFTGWAAEPSTISTRDLATGVLTRRGQVRPGTYTRLWIQLTRLDASGRYIAYSAHRPRADPDPSEDPTQEEDEIYVEDTRQHRRVRVSTGIDGSGANTHTTKFALSGDGHTVVFETYASNFVAGDTNEYPDVFARRLDWGAPPADIDGDSDTDLTVFRPSTGEWLSPGVQPVKWGLSGDVPVMGDYDGDGRADPAVYRPSDRTWYLRGVGRPVSGSAGDIPVPADYDGDGDTDVAMFRPSTGVWYVKDQAAFAWGKSGDVPVPADYDGDGTAEPAVFRNGTWYIRGRADTIAWGKAGDVPLPGDYDGGGDAELAVYRPSTGTWYVRDVMAERWGIDGDIPVPGDYDGDGRWEIAVYRPSQGRWYPKGRASTAWGVATTDLPVVAPVHARP